MNAVIGMTELLLDTGLGGEQLEYAQTVKESATLLLGLINDILDFSKFEAGKVTLEKLVFDLTNVVESSVEGFATKAREKGLAIMSFVSPTLPREFMGDPLRISQVLENLIGNAIKFTETGEVIIAVEGKKLGGQYELRFAVRDTGVGIPETANHLLFQPFTQADGSTTRKYGGTGLGLAISKKLVELMGGTIRFKSQEGKGSTFIFTIQLESSSPVDPPSSFLEGVNVLIVDEHPFQAEILGRYIRAWGGRPELSHSIREAELRLAVQQELGQSFQIVIVDFSLPRDQSGVDFVQQIRCRAEYQEMVIIFVSAYDSDHLENIAYNAGVDLYMRKPLKEVEFAKLLTAGLVGETRRTAVVKPQHPEDTSSTTLIDRGHTPNSAEEEGIVPQLSGAWDQAANDNDFDPQILRQDILEGIKSLQNADEPSLLEDLVKTYIQDVDENLRLIQLELLNKNYKQLVHWFHRIKGSSANLGAVSLLSLLNDLEEFAHQHSGDLISQNLGKLNDEIDSFKKALKKEIEHSAQSK
jgi:CheY-like chemotaxis protein